jgi:pantoate kinase
LLSKKSIISGNRHFNVFGIRNGNALRKNVKKNPDPKNFVEVSKSFAANEIV